MKKKIIIIILLLVMIVLFNVNHSFAIEKIKPERNIINLINKLFEAFMISDEKKG